MKRVLFVCTGNICRSPTAEAFFADLVRRSKLENLIYTDSVGIENWHQGKPPDPRAIESLRDRGVDMRHLRARKITDDDFWQNDLILAMDRSHLDYLKKHTGPDAGEIHLFLDSLGRNDDVPDPYYGTEQDFDDVLDLIEDGCNAWFEKVLASLP